MNRNKQLNRLTVHSKFRTVEVVVVEKVKSKAEVEAGRKEPQPQVRRVHSYGHHQAIKDVTRILLASYSTLALIDTRFPAKRFTFLCALHVPFSITSILLQFLLLPRIVVLSLLNSINDHGYWRYRLGSLPFAGSQGQRRNPGAMPKVAVLVESHR